MSDEFDPSQALPFASVVLKLLQGPLYDDDPKNWALLKDHAVSVRSWFAQMGLKLVWVKEDGLAYLTQPEEEGAELPRLVKRSPLGYDATVLAVVLRDALEEFDLSSADSRDLFLTARDIQTRMSPYTGGRWDETRAWKQFERSLNHMVRLGFLRETPTQDQGDLGRKVFQVMRILKIKLGPAALEELKEKILAYQGKEGTGSVSSPVEN